ncbi:MAG: (2Fe-2S)-binding protein [Lachnospiraceae bacterium]|nr:(2Fe-2S)-binding protein [Lachnospiraceae bacterium]HCJ09196.1 (2Fe-2S)-binding protein [Lachnospiraceae bacterium]
MICVNDIEKEIGVFVPMEDDDVLVCRCEEVTKGEIRRAVHAGMTTIEEMRRFLRCGMGLCQGQTCGKLVKGIVAAELKINPLELEPAVSRAPMRPVEMKVMGKDGGQGGDAV